MNNVEFVLKKSGLRFTPKCVTALICVYLPEIYVPGELKEY